MKKADLYFNLSLLVLSVFGFVEGTGYPYKYRGSPGSGFFPVWIAVLLFVLSSTNLFRIFRSLRREEDKPFFTSTRHRNRMLAFFISLFVYILGITYLGMLVATFIYSIFVYKIFDRFSWKSSMPTAIGLVLFVHIVFNLILGLRLPTGFWH